MYHFNRSLQMRNVTGILSCVQLNNHKFREVIIGEVVNIFFSEVFVFGFSIVSGEISVVVIQVATLGMKLFLFE